jgi:hypothetical protein
MHDALRFGQQGGSVRLVVVDLRLVEDRIAPREKAAALGLVLAVVLRSSGADLLPEDDGRGALALAHLGAERLPVAVGAPDAGRVTGALRCDPEREPVDPPIGFARCDVDRARDRGVAAVPGHAVLAGSGLNGRDNLGGDAGVDVRAIRGGHDQASPAQKANRTLAT